MPVIKLLVEGGNMKPGPAVAQQLGPMGINMGKVISDVNEATSDFKGVTVPVVLDVDASTKEFTIKVLSPPTSELIKKELGIEKASGERLKLQVGNLAIEQVISIAKTKHPSLLANEFGSAVKSIIGTCMAMGVLIESKDPKEVLSEISEGIYKQEIDSRKTDVSTEKKKELDTFFENLSAEQQAAIKAEEEAKAAEEEKKAEAVAGAAAPTADGEKVVGETPAEKKEAK